MHLNLQIDKALNGILADDRFLGGAVWSREGEMLSSKMPESYDCDMLAETMNAVAGAFETASRLGPEVESTEFTFDDMRLIVRRLGEFFIVVLAEHRVQAGFIDTVVKATEKRMNRDGHGLDTSDVLESVEPLEEQEPVEEDHDLKRRLEEDTVILFDNDQEQSGEDLQKKLNQDSMIFFDS